MDNDLITVEILINKVLFIFILISIDYKYYSIINKDFIIELRLLYIKIPPKPITWFIKENTKEPWVKITKITKFSIDI